MRAAGRRGAVCGEAAASATLAAGVGRAVTGGAVVAQRAPAAGADLGSRGDGHCFAGAAGAFAVSRLTTLSRVPSCAIQLPHIFWFRLAAAMLAVGERQLAGCVSSAIYFCHLPSSWPQKAGRRMRADHTAAAVGALPVDWCYGSSQISLPILSTLYVLAFSFQVVTLQRQKRTLRSANQNSGSPDCFS